MLEEALGRKKDAGQVNNAQRQDSTTKFHGSTIAPHGGAMGTVPWGDLMSRPENVKANTSKYTPQAIAPLVIPQTYCATSCLHDVIEIHVIVSTIWHRRWTWAATKRVLPLFTVRFRALYATINSAKCQAQWQSLYGAGMRGS